MTPVLRLRDGTRIHLEPFEPGVKPQNFIFVARQIGAEVRA